MSSKNILKMTELKRDFSTGQRSGMVTAHPFPICYEEVSDVNLANDLLRYMMGDELDFRAQTREMSVLADIAHHWPGLLIA